MSNYKKPLIKRECLVKSLALFGMLGANLLTAGCVGNGTSSSSVSNNNSLSNRSQATKSSNRLRDDFFLLTMGSGYDLVTNKAASDQSCLAKANLPGNVIVSNPTASFKFEQNEDITKLQNELSVDVTGSGGGDRFSGSVAATFANSAKDDNYSTNLIYLYKYAGIATFKSLGQGESALTPQAAAMVQQPTALRRMCGNAYVAQMTAGATLAIDLKLSFNSHSDKENFDAKMSASGGLAGVAAEIQQAASSANVHVNISLSAIQQGGQPQRLNEIFGESDAQGNYPIVKCGNGIDQSDACALMISNIINYAQTIENQVSDGHGGVNMDRVYYSKPVVQDYTTLGIPTHGAPDPSADILAAMQQLTMQYDKIAFDYAFVTHYANVLRNQLDPGVANALDDSADKLNNQLNNVFNLPAYRLTDCYRGYVSTDCLRIRDNVENAVSKYALSDYETQIIDYLENNSYTAKLVNYYGESVPETGDYHETSCILAPIDSWIDQDYAINCDGKWLAYQGSGVTIMPGFAGNGLNITNLSYFSAFGTSGIGQWISYTDFHLDPDLVTPGEYRGFTDIIAPNYLSKNSKVNLVNKYSNQA